jgi:hypothetical protein
MAAETLRVTLRFAPDELRHWDRIAGRRGLTRLALIEDTMRKVHGRVGDAAAPPPETPRHLYFGRAK